MVSGKLFFKIIVCESYLDSNATVAVLWWNLTNLNEYVTTNGLDIVAFNAYIQSQVDGYASSTTAPALNTTRIWLQTGHFSFEIFSFEVGWLLMHDLVCCLEKIM